MRNLKRALSLAMASVMLMGMMVVGSSAAKIDDFTDKDKIVNKDAVAVTSQIGIFAGFEDGSFGGDKAVTRAEMTVIICKLLYGSDVNASQFTGTSSFTDVPAWAEGYVNLCASLGIVAGVGNNKFDPNATVTTAQAALMLEKALGYFKNEKDYNGNWMLAATAKATSLKMFGDLKLVPTAPLTRNDVAVLTFNTLTKAVPVQYNEMFGVYYTDNSNMMAGVKMADEETLGYKNFDLVKKSSTADEMGRPSSIWGTGTATFDGDGNFKSATIASKNEIVNVADEATLSYTKSTDGDDIKDDMDLESGATYTVYLNGDKVATPFATVNKPTDAELKALTRKGAVTQIFVSKDADEATIVVSEYKLAKINRVSNDSSKGDYITLEGAKYYTESFKKGDYVVYTIGKDGSDTVVTSATAAKVVTGEVTAIGRDSASVTMDGTKYDNGAKLYIGSDISTSKLGYDYTLYLDPNGYVLGNKEGTGESNTSYLYASKVGESFGKGDFQVKATFSDGKTSVIEAEEADGTQLVANSTTGMFSYTESDGVYTLTAVSTQLTGDIQNDYPTVTVSGTTVKFDLDTIFVDVDKNKVYVGYEAVPSYDGSSFFYYADAGKAADIVFVYAGDQVDSEGGEYFYITDANSYTISKDSKTTYYNYDKAFIDGEQVTVKIAASSTPIANNDNGGKALYKIDKMNSAGNPTGITQVTINKSVVSVGATTLWLSGETEKYTLNDETQYIVVDRTSKTDGKTHVVYVGDIDDLKDSDDTVVMAKVLNSNGRVAEQVIIEITNK